MGQAAKMIAEAITAVDTDDRGDLFVLVSRELRKNTQFFTATCIDAASLMYGTSREHTEEELGRPH